MGLPLREYLDGLTAPIVVVDGDGRVTTANRQARTFLRKDLPEIEGYRGGEVFECEHARLPEGCGQTVHCSGCTIRMAVMDTLRTGVSRLRAPACLDCHTGNGVQRVEFLISTEKAGDVVLLRIDEVVGEPEACAE
jgi:PAS domain-containing protein